MVAPSLPATSFAQDLGRYGDRVALVAQDMEISYQALAVRVSELARRLGSQRRLVMVAGANTVDALVAYLGALAGGHPVLLVPGDSPRSLKSLVDTYDPDVVIDALSAGANGGAGAEATDLAECELIERRVESAHELHPELALLLPTSGSTGSAKLVRLSLDNLQANAESIATYLDIRDTDRAATTLPMHYCYGLSVVNSYLLRGASLLLTTLSVADEGFWELFLAHRGTSFAGVPYTFELLERVGFDHMRLPDLRYVTQAGGRMAPERVRRYAELGRRDGWRLFVMYGQTEATARMAYLPPEQATSHPQCVGVPIPGGSFRLEPMPEWPEQETGELVYSGPNVMLGYADTPADLAQGRSIDELHTGDIARRTPDGLYEIVGRRSRFVKVFGLRIDLQRVETMLERRGVTACCAGDDGELVVAVEGAPAGEVGRLVAEECGLPVRAIRVCNVSTLPRLANGKPDYQAVRALPPPAPEATSDVRQIFADVLGRDDVTDESTFVGLGGDSLSYVEASVRLERALGELPGQWHTTPIRQLRRAAGRRRRRATIDTSVALRAIAIVFIVVTHAGLFGLAGGAHLLMGVAGFNFARFQLTGAGRAERSRGIARSIGRVALASMAWIGLVALVTGDYSLANVFLLNYVFGTGGEDHWHFWFIESLVYIQIGALALLAVPWLDRLERRWPFGLPMAVMAVGLVTRYELVPGADLPTPAVVPWLFALGWAAAKATTRAQRWLATLAIVATVPGFFGNPQREAVMVAGLVLLVWVSRLPSLRSFNRVAAVLASASLAIYLTHWQVFPLLDEVSPVLAVAASLLVGIGYAAVVTRLMRYWGRFYGGRGGSAKRCWGRFMVGWSGARSRPGDRRREGRRHALR